MAKKSWQEKLIDKDLPKVVKMALIFNAVMVGIKFQKFRYYHEAKNMG